MRGTRLDYGDLSEPARARRLSRVRGLFLGLALGDALAAGEQPGPLLVGTSTTQLACFTVEGLIRAAVRGQAKGICHPASVVWRAYRRWAAIQRIDVAANGLAGEELDGWLCEVPALAARRGSAPAMVAALLAAKGPQAAPAPVTSRGHHALTRLLPLAAATAHDLDHDVTEMAAATHGHPEALEAARLGVGILSVCLTVSSTAEAIGVIGTDTVPGVDVADVVDPSRPLSSVAPDHGAMSALRGGLALAARCDDPDPAAIRTALEAARQAPAPDAVGPVAGAVLGALHGAECLPVDLLARLELGWVVEVLARDMVAQFETSPAGDSRGGGADPSWWQRYPGV